MPDADPPAPLELTDDHAADVAARLYANEQRFDSNDRLLIEILDALRRIYDKLERLLDRVHE